MEEIGYSDVLRHIAELLGDKQLRFTLDSVELAADGRLVTVMKGALKRSAQGQEAQSWNLAGQGQGLYAGEALWKAVSKVAGPFWPSIRRLHFNPAGQPLGADVRRNSDDEVWFRIQNMVGHNVWEFRAPTLNEAAARAVTFAVNAELAFNAAKAMYGKCGSRNDPSSPGARLVEAMSVLVSVAGDYSTDDNEQMD